MLSSSQGEGRSCLTSSTQQRGQSLEQAGRDDFRKSQRASGRKRSRDRSTESDGAASPHTSQQRGTTLRYEPERCSSESEDGATPTRAHDGAREKGDALPQALHVSGGECSPSTDEKGDEERVDEMEEEATVYVGPSLATTHAVVGFLASIELQGFSARLITENGIDTYTALETAATSAAAAANLLGPFATRKQRTELWKGLVRRQRETEREERRRDAESRSVAFAEAREARERARHEKRQLQQARAGKRADHRGGVESTFPVLQQLRLEDCTTPERRSGMGARGAPAEEEVRDGSSSAHSSQLSVPQEPATVVDSADCSASQLFDSLFAESDALHERSRNEITRHMGRERKVRQAKHVSASFEKENVSATQFMSSFRYTTPEQGPSEVHALVPVSSAVLSSPVPCVAEHRMPDHGQDEAHAVDAEDSSSRSGGGGGGGAVSQESTGSPYRFAEEEEEAEAARIVERQRGRHISYWSMDGFAISPAMLPAPCPSPCPERQLSEQKGGSVQGLPSLTGTNSSTPPVGALSASTAEACVTPVEQHARPALSPHPFETADGDAEDALVQAIEAHLRAYNALPRHGHSPGTFPKLRAVLVPLWNSDKEGGGEGMLVEVDTATATAGVPDEDEERTVVLPSPLFSPQQQQQKQQQQCVKHVENAQEEYATSGGASSSTSSVDREVTASAVGTRRSGGFHPTQHSAPHCTNDEVTQISSGDSSELSSFVPSQALAVATGAGHGGVACPPARTLSYTPDSASPVSAHPIAIQNAVGGEGNAEEEEGDWWERLGLDALRGPGSCHRHHHHHSCPTTVAVVDPFLPSYTRPPAPQGKRGEKSSPEKPELVLGQSDEDGSASEEGEEKVGKPSPPILSQEAVLGDEDRTTVPLQALVQLYQQDALLERQPVKKLTELCATLGVRVAAEGAVDSGSQSNATLSAKDMQQLEQEAMGDALKQVAVRAIFRYGVAPAILHRVQRVSRLPYYRVKASELIARGSLLTAADREAAKRSAKAEEQEEVNRCILAALAAETAECVEAQGHRADPSTHGRGLTSWERALLREPVDADAAASTVQQSFPFISYARVHRMLEQSDIPLEVVHYGRDSPCSSISSSPPPPPPLPFSCYDRELQAHALVPSDDKENAFLRPFSSCFGDAGSNGKHRNGSGDVNSYPRESSNSHSPSPSRSRSRSPHPQTLASPGPDSPLPPPTPSPVAQRRESTRRYFASQGFRTRGGLWRGRAGRGGGPQGF